MYFTKITLALSVVVLFTFIAVKHVGACECSRREKEAPVSEAFEKAEMVITGTVVSKPDENGWLDQHSVKVRVEKTYKGKVKVGDVLIFGQARGADCRWYFTKEKVGKTYLFYLAKPTKEAPYKSNENIEISDPELKYYPSICGRSADIEKAASDITYLDKLSPPEP